MRSMKNFIGMMAASGVRPSAMQVARLHVFEIMFPHSKRWQDEASDRLISTYYAFPNESRGV